HMVASGDERLIATYVRPTLAGEKIGALAITEPGEQHRAVVDGDLGTTHGRIRRRTADRHVRAAHLGRGEDRRAGHHRTR
ncbi:hypothetical protein GR254_24865, partial [Mycobacterium tuberculosis]|nr:hypothetical protein [Mycobacterium tuberculosis]